MSEDWIVLIPEDPRFIPDEEKREQGRDRMTTIVPDADGIEIEIEVFDTVQFFHCGANFGRIFCPGCRSEIPFSWWQGRMDEDYGDGFKLASYPTPCCGAVLTLHELIYEWQQGFGRFALSARNPNIGLLSEGHRAELETIVGTKFRVIYRHI